MADVTVVLQVPEDLLIQVKNVSDSFKSDFNSDMIILMESYVKSYQNLLRDPAAKALLEVK